MKNRKILASCLVLFLLSFTFLKEPSFAEDLEQKQISTENTIKTLTKSVQKILDLLIVALKPKEEMNFLDTINSKIASYYLPHCLSDWETWNSSNKFTPNSQWNMSLFPEIGNTNNRQILKQYLDLNGDGLVDYFYTENMNVSVYDGTTRIANYSNLRTCVLLNTGLGWDIAHRCVTVFDTENLKPIYYGDCADTSK